MCPFTVRVPHGYGLAVFLGSVITPAIASRERSAYCQVRLSRRTSLPRSTPTPFNRLFRQPAGLPLLRPRVTPWGSDGIFTVSSIGVAVRLSLRSRLTLIRLALIRRPWSFGGGGSRPPYRYSYLHLPFHALQSPSPGGLRRTWNAPLPRLAASAASARGLCPIIIHARSLD